MKILVIGNYSPSGSESMRQFATLLAGLLEEAGHDVRLVRPTPILGKLKSGEAGLAKWLGYVDRFLLFPPRLLWVAGWADRVHVCDHSNTMYVRWLRGRPHVVTCHDMIAIRSAIGEIPEHPTRWTGRIQQRWTLRWLRRAQHVVCVSEQTRTELVRLSGLPAGRTSVVPNAPNYPYRPTDRAEASLHLGRLGLADARPFLFHVGGNQWYKNRVGVLRIFKEIVSAPEHAGLRLVMAGKPWTNSMHDYVRQAGMEGRVIELTNVSNEELRALYSTAEALLFPSLYEGFGWPIIEAQACGCPVFTSDRLPMTEVGGRGAVYFDPADELGAARIVAAHLGDRDGIRILAAENPNRFSRDTMLAGYLEAYRKVVAERTGRHDSDSSAEAKADRKSRYAK